jgi:hypothetical protein
MTHWDAFDDPAGRKSSAEPGNPVVTAMSGQLPGAIPSLDRTSPPSRTPSWPWTAVDPPGVHNVGEPTDGHMTRTGTPAARTCWSLLIRPGRSVAAVARPTSTTQAHRIQAHPAVPHQVVGQVLTANPSRSALDDSIEGCPGNNVPERGSRSATGTRLGGDASPRPAPSNHPVIRTAFPARASAGLGTRADHLSPAGRMFGVEAP